MTENDAVVWGGVLDRRDCSYADLVYAHSWGYHARDWPLMMHPAATNGSAGLGDVWLQRRSAPIGNLVIVRHRPLACQ